MAHRLEIELTSRRDDETWTWRAAGARQPRGVIPASMLEGSPKVGDVLRVEANVELDGMTILSIVPPRERRESVERIAIVDHRPPPPAVTSTLVERRGGGGRRPPGEGRGEPRPRRDAPAGRDASVGRAASGERRPSRPRDTTGESPGEQRPRPPRRDATRTGTERPNAARPPAREGAPSERAARTRSPRLTPKSVHRDAHIATLPAEQRPIAEQLAQGGLPAVRRALGEEQAAARAASRPVAGGEAIIAIAEQLLPGVRAAVWLDRAEAAAAALETITLRDLRAAVAGAAPHDDAGRALLEQLRSAYDERLTKLRTGWEESIKHALDEGRVLQALRLSARLPEPSARFPAGLVPVLAEAASTALGPQVPAERWVALLEAAAASPVRRLIHPAGLPSDDDGSARQFAAASAGQIPQLASLLGLKMPPPPGPRSAVGRPVPPPPPRARRAPRPPADSTASPEATAAESETTVGSEVEAAAEAEEVVDPGAQTGNGAVEVEVEVEVEAAAEAEAEIETVAEVEAVVAVEAEAENKAHAEVEAVLEEEATSDDVEAEPTPDHKSEDSSRSDAVEDSVVDEPVEEPAGQVEPT